MSAEWVSIKDELPPPDADGYIVLCSDYVEFLDDTSGYTEVSCYHYGLRDAGVDFVPTHWRFPVEPIESTMGNQ